MSPFAPARCLCLAAATLSLQACGGRNQVPTAPEIDIEPSIPYTRDDLRIVFLEPSFDPDGDTLRYHTRWFQDGEIRADVHGDVVPSGRTQAGEYWIAEIWADDGLLEGPVAEATAYVFNSLPTASVRLTPADPDTLVDIVARSRIQDLDGDTLELEHSWTVDGEPSGHSGDTIPAADTREGQAWEVQVIPYDGDDWGAAVSAAVTVGNAPPSRPGLVIEPEEPQPRESFLVCLVDEPAEDPDGDPLEYSLEWLVDGEPYQSGITTELEGDTVPPWATAPRQRWECRVRADDGDELGPMAKISVDLGR